VSGEGISLVTGATGFVGGHLVARLVESGARVRAAALPREDVAPLAGLGVEIVHADALGYDFDSLPGKWKVVANLPYYISTPLIQRLIGRREHFTTLTLMLQKEVAERIAALPGGKEYGFLSVLVQYSAAPRLEFSVPAGAFTPRPKVDSAVVTLTMRDRREQTVSDESLFLRVIKAAFSQRRKTLRNSLSQLGYPKEVMDVVHGKTGIDLGRRAETLSVAEFVLITDFFSREQAE